MLFSAFDLQAKLAIILSTCNPSKISRSHAIMRTLYRKSSDMDDLSLFFTIFSLLISLSAKQLVTGKVQRILYSVNNFLKIVFAVNVQLPTSSSRCSVLDITVDCEARSAM